MEEQTAYQLARMLEADRRKPFEGGAWFFLSDEQIESLAVGVLPAAVVTIATEIRKRPAWLKPAPKKGRRQNA